MILQVTDSLHLVHIKKKMPTSLTEKKATYIFQSLNYTSRSVSPNCQKNVWVNKDWRQQSSNLPPEGWRSSCMTDRKSLFKSSIKVIRIIIITQKHNYYNYKCKLKCIELWIVWSVTKMAVKNYVNTTLLLFYYFLSAVWGVSTLFHFQLTTNIMCSSS